VSHGRALAHVDTPIELHGTQLIGLPSNYSPAEFDATARRLRIGNHVFTFVGMLESFFEDPHKLRLSASWYHEADILPPYIVFHIQPRGKDHEFKILLSLDTLRVIEADITLHRPHDTLQHLPIALDEIQQKLIRAATKTVR
jgi:hypothetical protein